MGPAFLKNKALRKKVLEWFYITVGVAIASFAFSFFLNVNNIVIGGVSGISIIIKNKVHGYDPALSILIVNIILLILGLVLLGKEFLIKTTYGSLLYPAFISFYDWLYKVLALDFSGNSLDMMLIILFSSILMGAGLGMVMKHGGTTGGTEVLQKIAFKYLHVPFSASLFILDGLVIFFGLILNVASLQITLYAVVFTYISGIVMDTVVFSGFNKRAVYIISSKNEEIKNELLHKFERGVTSIKATGEYSKMAREILVCVLSSREYFRLRQIIEKYDPNAFYYAVRASEVRGEGFSYDV